MILWPWESLGNEGNVGNCFSLLVGARTRALLPEKPVGSALGWMQLPWQMLVPRSQPQGLTPAFHPTQAVLPAVGKWPYRGWMVSPQLGSSSQLVRGVFLQLQVLKQSKKEVLQENLMRESSGFSSDCVL